MKLDCRCLDDAAVALCSGLNLPNSEKVNSVFEEGN